MLEPVHLSLRPRWRAGLSVVAIVLAVHALALQATQGDAVSVPQRLPALSVRTIAAALDPAPAAPAAVIPPTEAMRPAAAADPVVRRLKRVASRAPLAEVAAVQPVQQAQAESSPIAAKPESGAQPAGASPQHPDEEIPVYRAKLPPPLLLHYELRRGGLTGMADLSWRPAGTRYEMRLEGRVAGLTLLTQASQGGIDAHGLAPLRFTDQRARRAAQAANFQRDKGVITFSGPSSEFVLVPGVQDRLSWMLQLGAIVAAEPVRARSGQKVVLYVVGSRGDADVWTFDSMGVESIATREGTLRAVRFMREPRRPVDSRVEIWLDPARHHVPLQAKLSNGADGDTFELLLRQLDPPP